MASSVETECLLRDRAGQAKAPPDNSAIKISQILSIKNFTKIPSFKASLHYKIEERNQFKHHFPFFFPRKHDRTCTKSYSCAMANLFGI